MMKTIYCICALFISCFVLHANEDHLVLVPTPITIIGDEAEHTVIRVPYVSGYGLDFIGYASRIASPYMVDVHSPSSRKKKVDINPLSQAGLSIDAQERSDSNVHIVTLHFPAVKGQSIEDQIELLRISMKCVYRFGDSCMSPFNTDVILKGIAKDSSLHKELSKILELRKLSQQKDKK